MLLFTELCYINKFPAVLWAVSLLDS